MEANLIKQMSLEKYWILKEVIVKSEFSGM